MMSVNLSLPFFSCPEVNTRFVDFLVVRSGGCRLRLFQCKQTSASEVAAKSGIDKLTLKKNVQPSTCDSFGFIFFFFLFKHNIFQYHFTIQQNFFFSCFNSNLKFWMLLLLHFSLTFSLKFLLPLTFIHLRYLRSYHTRALVEKFFKNF